MGHPEQRPRNHGASSGVGTALDISRRFLPETLAGVAPLRVLDRQDRLRLNQIRACSYVHLFDVFESALSTAARERAAGDPDTREVLAPLLRLDSFDHCGLFRGFVGAFAQAFPVLPRLVAPPEDLASTLAHATPLSLLVLALHIKLVTQQHYLVCVRGDERLEPHFVGLLHQHWTVECGGSTTNGSALAIQQVLSHALPGRIPSALRDYPLLIFVCDDVVRRQTELDIRTLEAARGEPLQPAVRETVLLSQSAAQRKSFLTMGIVNAAFVYAMRNVGPAAPATLAGIVSALSLRP